MQTFFISFFISFFIYYPVLAVGPLTSSEDFLNKEADGIVRFNVQFDFKNEKSEQPGLESSVGFLISLPSTLKEYAHRVALTSGHSFDLEPNYEILLEGGISQAMAKTGNSSIIAFELHPQYSNDSDFVDLCLVLLNTKLQNEELTKINYGQGNLPTKIPQSALLTTWGPSNKEKSTKDYRKRSIPLKVQLDKDQANEEIVTLGGVKREVITSPEVTYLSYFYPDPQKLSQEVIKKYNLNLSPVYIEQGDSGSRLLINQEEPAITTSSGQGELEGIEGVLTEMNFLRIQPYCQWIKSVVNTWSLLKL